MDLHLRIAESSEDATAYWLLVELLSPAKLLLDVDRFRFAKQTKRILSVPREANIFDYDILVDIASRHFLRRQGLVQRGAPGVAWAPTAWVKQRGEDLELPPQDGRHIPFLAQRHVAMRGAELVVDAPDVDGSLRGVHGRIGTVTTISADFDGKVDDAGSNCVTDGTDILVGTTSDQDLLAYFRFPLGSIGIADRIDDVDFKVNILSVVGSGPVVDIQAYNQDGQADPSPDSCATRVTRCTNDASPYVNDSTIYQSTGIITVDLGAAADSDVESAKDAVDRFSIGVNQDGAAQVDNQYSHIEANEHAGTDEPKLVITHTAGHAGPRVNRTRLASKLQGLVN